jgi:hypothetical protein
MKNEKKSIQLPKIWLLNYWQKKKILPLPNKRYISGLTSIGMYSTKISMGCLSEAVQCVSGIV